MAVGEAACVRHAQCLGKLTLISWVWSEAGDTGTIVNSGQSHAPLAKDAGDFAVSRPTGFAMPRARGTAEIRLEMDTMQRDAGVRTGDTLKEGVTAREDPRLVHDVKVADRSPSEHRCHRDHRARQPAGEATPPSAQ
jgi:hypothetical protein